MLKDREKIYQLYHTVLSMSLTCALILGINQYYELKVNVFLCVFFSFLPTLLVYLFDMNRKNVVSYLILLSLFILIGFILWLRKVNLWEWINNLVNWSLTYNGTEEMYIGSYPKFIIFAIGMLGGTFLYLLMKNQIIKVLMAITILAAMIVLSLNKVDLYKVVIGIGIFYIMTIIIEIYGALYNRRAEKLNRKEGILYLTPVCLLLAVLSILLPSKPEPIQWEGAKTFYRIMKEQVEDWIIDIEYYFEKSNGDFVISLSGYSDENGDLGDGGVLTLDETIAFDISGSKGSKPIYLMGSVSNEYTGNRWEKTNQKTINGQQEYLLDYSELVYGLSRQKIEQLEEIPYINQRKIKIEYGSIKTKTFFYPLKSSYFNVDNEKKRLQRENANIRFDKAQGRNTSYDLIFYEMNLSDEYVQEMLREEKDFSYKEVEEINQEALDWLNDNYFRNDKVKIKLSEEKVYEQLQSRAQIIEMEYKDLPKDLPDRVKKLAEEITAHYETDYDRLKAIEAFLQQYTYTLSPGKLPEGKDFVDYFLFENKKGYCTAFASSLAVMGRCIGIPTRYVEGYVARFDNVTKSGMYPVKNRQAHAWAEAYIEGIGWIPFEATPDFYSIRYQSWGDKSKYQNGGVSDYKPYGHLNDYEVPPLPGSDESLLEETMGENNHILMGITITVVAILILLFVVLIYDCLLKYQYRKRMGKANNNERMYLLFLRILYLLKLEGYTLKQEETIKMLAYQIKDTFDYENIKFADVANIFMRYRYGEVDITAMEVWKVGIFQQGLSNKRKQEQSKFRIWFEEFIFLTNKGNWS